MHPWLKALRHDLVKRAVWPARDLRDLSGQDLPLLRRGLFELTDEEGARVTAEALWQRMRAQAPPGSGAACEAFQAALQRAIAGLESPWPGPLDAILALEPAFDALARAVDSTERR
jgi:hypothetical protein